jgi:hypothetical protein
MNCCRESNPIIAKTVRARPRGSFQILKAACSGGHINYRGAMNKGISHVAINTGQDQIEALVPTSDGKKTVEAFISPSSPRSGTSFGILGEKHENPQASFEDCRRKNVLLLQIEQHSIGQPFRWLRPEPPRCRIEQSNGMKVAPGIVRSGPLIGRVENLRGRSMSIQVHEKIPQGLLYSGENGGLSPLRMRRSGLLRRKLEICFPGIRIRTKLLSCTFEETRQKLVEGYEAFEINVWLVL